MNHIFIFGAGASKDAGGPLIGDFLDQADRLRRVKSAAILDSIGSFENVFQAISDLNSVFAKSVIDVDNLESLFGAIEMAGLVQKFSNRSAESIAQLRSDMVTLIVRTLEANVTFPIHDHQLKAPRPYDEFIHSLYGLSYNPAKTPAPEYSFITFNYDIALDYALHRAGRKIDYGLSSDPEPGGSELMKLHGSTNWGYCQSCKTIVPIPFKVADPLPPNLGSETTIPISRKLFEQKHLEGCALEPIPVLVPPSWSKSLYHTALRRVWQRAAKILECAESIFIVGYSLPETDSFFRYLFALGTQSESRIQRLWVIDPDGDDLVRPRYESLIGRALQRRVSFHKKTFAQSIPSIVKAIKGE